MSLITIRDLSYQYPIAEEEALKAVNLTFEEGKFHAIIGANGAGKTTLCNVIRGFIPHFFKGDLRGKVRFQEKEIRDWDLGELATQIGYVFQNPYTQLSGVKETVWEEIAFGLENLGVEPKQIKDRVEQMLQTFSISSLRDKKPFELSGGEKQRVALASITAMDPPIMVIDEPTSQLDPQGTESIFDIISWLKEQGKTIILVEHKIERIAEHADYVIVMHKGTVVKQGPTVEVLTDEQLLSVGAPLPQHALFGLAMREQNMDLGQLPITEQQTIAAIRKRLEKEDRQ
jgi:energy-coupling factor transport system ATP-binding protein